jgi:hypothetical protein
LNSDQEKFRQSKRSKAEIEFEEAKAKKELAEEAKRYREFEVKKVAMYYRCYLSYYYLRDIKNVTCVFLR